MSGTSRPALLVPAGVARGPEESRPAVVVDAVNPPAGGREVGHDLGADQAGGAGDEEGAYPHCLNPPAPTARAASV